MRVDKRLATRFFDEKEILSVEKFYEFINRIKIIVFVPDEHTEKVMLEMFRAGAGKIGNYEMCSFSTGGTGTYRPNENARPFAGKKNLLSRASEIKFEVECDPEYLNEALEVLFKHHPYEEIAYEIHSFKKRGNETGVIVNLKKGIKMSQLVKRLNKKIADPAFDSDMNIMKIALTNNTKEEHILESAKLTSCEYLIIISNNNHKLFKI